MADETGTLWGRRARLTITNPSGTFAETATEEGPANQENTLIIEGADGDPPGFRVTFRIVKTSGKEPNTAEIVIYNLSKSTRAKLQQKGLLLLLEVGYVSTGLERLFVGDVRSADPSGDRVDWKLTLKCGDGERSLRYAYASESFAGPLTVGDVVKFCVKQMGLALGNTADQAAKLSTQLAHGWTVHGAAATELDRILRSVGYRYSVQDGEVQILQPGKSVSQTIPDLDVTSGLLGSPELGSPDKKGKPATLKYKALLMPAARPGGRNRVKSIRYDGVFRTLKVEHVGDTRSNDWYSLFESVADGTVKVA